MEGRAQKWERKGAGERDPGNALLLSHREDLGNPRKAIPSCRRRMSTSTLTVHRSHFPKKRDVSRVIRPEAGKAEGAFEKERKA